MAAMNPELDKKTTWWREPMVWLIMALPLTAVIAGLTTVWIAFSKADKVLTDEDSQSVGVTQANEMDKRAYFLHIAAQAVVADGSLKLDLQGRLSGKPERLSFRVIPQTGTGTDTLLVLQPGHDGKYTSLIPAMSTGPCKVVLEPEDHKWRLSGLWQTPFNGSLALVAKPTSDSSMLP